MRVALLLAAGEGRRFGRRDKLLETLGGRPLLMWSLRAAREGGLRTILVLPPGFARRRALVARVRWPGLIVRTAFDARRGIGASIAAGVRVMRPIDREAMIFLADMPFARAHSGRLKAGCDAVRPMDKGRPGHPVLARVSAMRGLEGHPETGLNGFIRRDRLTMLRGGKRNVLDIDTPAALIGLRRRIAARGGAFRFTNEERRC